MPPTEKPYLTDPHETAFQARVVSAKPLEKGRFDVVLDRTCFYPDSGGQLCDHGRISGAPVIDVREADGGAVVHTVHVGEAPAGMVEGSVDWDRRYDHMQQHTGQHVLSRAFIEIADLHTVSFHMGDESCTIDLEGDGFDEEISRRAEAMANRIIEENRPVTSRTVAIDELDTAELRRKVPEGVSDVRLVEVAGLDVIPCCGTHVAATGELRLIKVLKAEKAKNNTRVYFKVGRRALADYERKHDILQALSNRLTTSEEDVAAKVEKLVAEGQSGRKAIKRLTEKLAVLEKDLLVAAADTRGKVRLIVQLLPDADGGYLRQLCAAIRTVDNVVALVGAGDGSFVGVAGEGMGVDLSGAVDLARAMGGSGGGRGGFVQAKLPPSTDMKKFLENIRNDVLQSL